MTNDLGARLGVIETAWLCTTIVMLSVVLIMLPFLIVVLRELLFIKKCMVRLPFPLIEVSSEGDKESLPAKKTSNPHLDGLEDGKLRHYSVGMYEDVSSQAQVRDSGNYSSVGYQPIRVSRNLLRRRSSTGFHNASGRRYRRGTDSEIGAICTRCSSALRRKSFNASVTSQKDETKTVSRSKSELCRKGSLIRIPKEEIVSM